MSDDISFKAMKGCRLNIIKLQVDSGIKAFKMKAMSNGNLWLNELDKVFITTLQCDGGLEIRDEFSIQDEHGNKYDVTSISETVAGPVLACTGHHTDDSKYGLIQVDYKGKKDCLIAEGHFHQMTVGFGEGNRHVIYGLRENNIVSAHRYMENNNGNKWVHIKDIFLSSTPLPGINPQPKQEYKRIKAKCGAIMVSTRTETNAIDQINVETETFIKRHTYDKITENGLYMCCIDRDQTLLVADVIKGGLYILENDSTWTQLNVVENNLLGSFMPHDVTICKGAVLLVNTDGTLFKLSVAGEQTHL